MYQAVAWYFRPAPAREAAGYAFLNFGQIANGFQVTFDKKIRFRL